jgi:uncharacterized cupin superfamily protein
MSDATPVVTPALSVDLAGTPVDTENVLAGTPTIGHEGLAPFAGVDLGIWELSEGTVTDVETDEVFVVLSGSAEISTEGARTVSVRAGDVVRLTAGTRTTWTVTERLRKIYIVAAS